MDEQWNDWTRTLHLSHLFQSQRNRGLVDDICFDPVDVLLHPENYPTSRGNHNSSLPNTVGNKYFYKTDCDVSIESIDGLANHSLSDSTSPHTNNAHVLNNTVGQAQAEAAVQNFLGFKAATQGGGNRHESYDNDDLTDTSGTLTEQVKLQMFVCLLRTHDPDKTNHTHSHSLVCF
jgi:hypothetical protein